MCRLEAFPIASQAADSDSEEEMSEAEELRQAAAAMAVSKKRARETDEIIDLLSDSDDEPLPVSPPLSRHASRPQAPAAPARYCDLLQGKGARMTAFAALNCV